MVDKDTAYEDLDAALRKASDLLAACAKSIRELQLTPDTNIARIGEAIVRIVDIQLEIYKFRPDLEPEHFKKDWNRPVD